MNISGWGISWNSAGADAGTLRNLFVTQMNNKFSNIKVKAGKRLAGHDESTYRATIVIAPEFLDKAAGSGDLQKILETNIPKLKSLRDVFTTLNKVGENLTLKGYVIDRQGNITYHGKNKSSDEDFEISLGNITDSKNYANVIYDHFGTNASAVMIASV